MSTHERGRHTSEESSWDSSSPIQKGYLSLQNGQLYGFAGIFMVLFREDTWVSVALLVVGKWSSALLTYKGERCTSKAFI